MDVAENRVNDCDVEVRQQHQRQAEPPQQAVILTDGIMISSLHLNTDLTPSV